MDNREFRNTLGHFATGVTVITAKYGEELIGLTANAFSSLSLDPPLILVCIDKRSGSLRAFKKGQPFVVNILEQNQEEECWGFAKKTDKFADANYSMSADDVPILNGNLATIECEVHEILEGGDHYIITGLVKNASYDQEKAPLLFFRGKIEKLAEAKEVS
ncbi:flavin reductase family protein [Neobacillus vireti]|uniref:flavin reductase family protein n=1 Tax=Neobacillus vireti TaxID=220686 RepID=UPI003000D466